METELSEYEQENRERLNISSDQLVKYYVTEKNDMGIIWNVFYDLNKALTLKTEHDGYQWERLEIKVLRTKVVKPENPITVRDLK